MVKTESDIERDFFAMVRESALGLEIKGGVYRSETRPYGSSCEDIVVKFLSGLDGQIQSGVVVMNVYVPDIRHGLNGRRIRNFDRIAVLQRLVLEFAEECGGNDYWVETDGTPTTMASEETSEHFIYTRLKFNRITE